MRQSPFRIRRGFTSKEDIRRKAAEVRAHLGLGLAPIGDLPSLLDETGITVYRVALGSVLQGSVSGAFLNHPRIGMAIAVNVETTPGRQTFTMAHELAHALYHSQSTTQVVSRWGRDDERERFADQWAGEFLVPLEGLRRAIESLGVKAVSDEEQAVYLQRYYGVSYATMLTRLQQARLVEPSAAPRLEAARPLAIASRLGYRVSAEQSRQDPASWGLARFPRRFLRLLARAIRGGRVSIPSAATLTGLTFDEISELVAPSAEESDPIVQEELGQFRDVRERTTT
jgi:Zn-dependent peptidase ImmA (M78 family)